MDVLARLPLWTAWVAIAAGILFLWLTWRHDRLRFAAPRFKGITPGYWIVLLAFLLQGLVLLGYGGWRLLATS